MQPSHLENNLSNNHHQIDSDIKKVKSQQVLNEFQNSSEHLKEHQPKSSRSSFATKEPTSEERPFAPFILNTLKVGGNTRFQAGAVAYNEKHNVILACPEKRTVQFYDATTLLPFEGIKTEQLDSQATEIVFWTETETFLLGCSDGTIYSYNLLEKSLQKAQGPDGNPVFAITFINSIDFAFSLMGSGSLFVGNLENEKLLNFYSNNKASLCLKILPKRNLLFSGLPSSSVLMYRTDRLPRLKILYSTRAHPGSNMVEIQSITINGKDYVITTHGHDFSIRIWHLRKKRMRLLRVIFDQEKVYHVVYLKNYKMLVTSYKKSYIKFWSWLSGKLEETLELNMEKCSHMFLMKDKNAIGVACNVGNQIKIVQSHSAGKNY